MNLTKLSFSLFVLLTLVLALIFFRSIFTYLLLSVLFTFILAPAVNWLERRHIPRWAGVIAIYTSIILVITWFTYRYIPRLVEEGNNLLTLINSETAGTDFIVNLPIVRSVNAFLQSLDARVPMMNLSEGFIESIDAFHSFVAKLPVLVLNNYQLILNTLSYFAMVPLIGFFLLKDGNKLVKDIFKIIPNRYFELSVILVNKVNEMVGNFLRAMIFEVISVSIMTSIALSIVGVRNSVLIGIVAGIANIIPYFGPFIGTSVAIITVLIDGNTALMPIINIIIAMYSVQVIDNNIVYPVVVGTTISMHPLIVLLTVLAGGWYGGILWMLISVPLVYLVYNIVKMLFINLKKFHLI